MGFFSTIGGFIDSAISTAASTIKQISGSISEFVSSSVEKFGPGLSKALQVIGPVLSMFPGQIGLVAKVITGLAQIFGVFDEKDDPEELGDRVLQAANAGVVREKYKSFDEYMLALKSFDLDESVSRSISKTEKLIVGTGLGIQGLSEHLDTTPDVVGSLSSLVIKSPDFFSEERIAKYISVVKDAEAVLDFLKGDLRGNEAVSVRDAIVKAELDIDNNRSGDEALAGVISAVKSIDEEES